jgi:hypothetical protein
VGFISLDELQISVVPLMSAEIPVPDPPPVTCIVTLFFEDMYRSAQRCARMTIVSDPLTVSFSWLETVEHRATTNAPHRNRFIRLTLSDEVSLEIGIERET